MSRSTVTIVTYHYRGEVERWSGGRLVWARGYSAVGQDGGVLYPWKTIRECSADAEKRGAEKRICQCGLSQTACRAPKPWEVEQPLLDKPMMKDSGK